MKKIFAMTAIAAAIAMPASAQSFQPTGYVGVGFGSSKTENANGTVGVAPNQVDFSLDKSKGAWKILGGMQLTPMWGIEAQWAELGERDVTLIQVAAPNAAAKFNAELEQWSLAGTGRYMFTQSFYVHGKLGATRNSVNGGRACVTPTACANLGSESNTGFLWGIGLGNNFTKNWGIKGGYENFGKIMDDVNGKSVKASYTGINVIYSF